MTGYFIRRFFQTLLFILVAWLAIYTVLVYIMPSGPKNQYEALIRETAAQRDEHPGAYAPGQTFGCGFEDPRSYERQLTDLDNTYGVGKSWPFGFLAWLYDPADRTRFDKNNNPVQIGLNFYLGGWHIQGSGILTGDFGDTLVTGKKTSANRKSEPLAPVLANKWANTSILVGLSFVVTLLFAVPIGIVSAVKQGSKLDHTLSFFSFFSFSMPPFMLATMLVVLLGVVPYQLRQHGLDWMPNLPAGYVADDGQYDNWINRIYHLILPVSALALPQIAWISRQLRFSMLDVMQHDYVRTAHAKGLTQFRVVSKHILRNALLPFITVVALAIPIFISGSIQVETVFGYSGWGQLYFEALGGCLVTGPTGQLLCPPGGLGFIDYPMTLTLTLIIIVVVASANMIADILYAVADPRVDYRAKA